MVDFLRPEARASLWRWRETIAGIGIAIFGAWWLGTFFQPVQWVGWGFVALGIVLAIAGAQRAMFRHGAGGPGVVKLVERRVGYFGPLTGGAMDMDDVTALSIEPNALPAAHWILQDGKGQELAIPVNAEGAEVLFDAFSSLPGIQTRTLLNALNTPPPERVVIWQIEPRLLH